MARKKDDLFKEATINQIDRLKIEIRVLSQILLKTKAQKQQFRMEVYEKCFQRELLKENAKNDKV